MVEPAGIPKSARRAKRLALATAGGSVIALGAVVASIGPRNLARGAWIAWKLERGTTKDEGYDCVRLARTGVPWARRLVERRLSSRHESVRKRALEAVKESFPESETARAIAEYEAISGESYFDGWTKFRGLAGRLREPGTLDERIARWERFIQSHEDFPGRDDAGYRLARAYEEKGLPRDAFRTLVLALGWGDRDCGKPIRDRITNVLDAQCDLDDARSLLAEADEDWKPILEYSVAIKLAQARRFDEATRALDDFARQRRGRDFAMLSHAPSYEAWDDSSASWKRVAKVEAFWGDLDRQRAVLADLAAIEARPAPAARARAAKLLAMGARVIDEPHAFENLVLHDTVLTNRAGAWSASADECHEWDLVPKTYEDERMKAYVLARNHLIQAAGFLERAVAEDPFGPDAPRAAFLGARARLGVLSHHLDVAPTWGRRPGHDVCQALSERERRRLAGRAVAIAFAVSFARDPRLALAAWFVLDHEHAVSSARGSKPRLIDLVHDAAPERGEVALGR